MSDERPDALERCPVMDGTEMELSRNIVIVPKANADLLTEKEEVDYYEHWKTFLTFLLEFGKNPEKA